MADALSLVANIIAVSSAAATISKKLLDVVRFYKAPQQILVLHNEVSDFQIILASAQLTTQRIIEAANSDRQELQFMEHMQSIISRSRDILSQIELIAVSAASKNPQVIFKKFKKAKELSTTLQNVRRELAEALTVITAAAVPHVQISLNQISLHQQQIHQQINQQIHHLSGEIGRVTPTSDALRVGLERLQVIGATSNPRVPELSSFFNVQTSASSICQPSCLCKCHSSSEFRSPLWLKGIIGLIFVGYSGRPVARRMACTKTSCHRRVSTLLKVNYFFPTWLLHRMLVFRHRWDPSNSQVITVRTPRIVAGGAAIFQASVAGNLEVLRSLFVQGLASPFDVTPMGGNALTYAVGRNHIAVAKFLLEQYADPHQYGPTHQSPVEKVWDQILRRPLDPITIELKNVFSSFLDPVENLQDRRFSVLHCIILQLTPIDLESYLLISGADIERTCSKGWTPIFWAVWRNDVSSTRILLKYGASINHTDKTGKLVFHIAAVAATDEKYRDIEILQTLLDEANSRNLSDCQLCGGNSTMPSSWNQLVEAKSRSFPCHFNPQVKNLLNNLDKGRRTALDIFAEQDSAAHAALLIGHGCVASENSLWMVIQLQCPRVLQVLLRAKLRCYDHYDEDGMGFLSMVGRYADLESIKCLLQEGICCLDPDKTDLSGFSPRQYFDTMRSEFLRENEVTHLQSCKAWEQLLAYIEVKSNTDHDCWTKKSSIPDGYASGTEDDEVDSLSSDNDVFYDAKIPMEQ